MAAIIINANVLRHQEISPSLSNRILMNEIIILAVLKQYPSSFATIFDPNIIITLLMPDNYSTVPMTALLKNVAGRIPPA